MDALKQATKRLIKDNPYPATLDYNADTGENVVRLGGPIPEPTSDIPAAVGDVLFNIRCALDHIVYALSARPGRCKEDQVGFPILKSDRGWPAAVRDKIGDIPAPAQAVIESLQPYNSGQPVERDSLFLLHELNRFDKHRTINTVVAYNFRAEAVWDSPDVVEVRTEEPPPGGFKEGAKIGWVMLAGGRRMTNMEVKFGLSRDILFGPGPAEWASVHWLLRNIQARGALALAQLEYFL